MDIKTEWKYMNEYNLHNNKLCNIGVISIKKMENIAQWIATLKPSA